MKNATLKIWTASGDIEIVEPGKKYRGFPGALNITKSMLTKMGIKYENSFGWDYYTANVTLEQWVKIRNELSKALNKIRGYEITDKKQCSKCGRHDVQFNTTGTDVCNDCA